MRFPVLIILIFFGIHSFAQVDSFKLIAHFTVDSINKRATEEGVPAVLLPLEFEVDVYKIWYQSAYYKGGTIQVSGAVAIPSDAPSNYHLPHLAYQHGTANKPWEVPSNVTFEGLLGVVTASAGFVTSMTDYIGLGESTKKTHPFLHAESHAQSGLNAMYAAREICDSINVSLNGASFIAGVSQGGHAAVALLKEIEANHSSEFNILKTVAVVGPYDLNGAEFDLITSNDTLSNPAFFPYLIWSMNDVYGLYDTIQQYFKEPYATDIYNHMVNGDASFSGLNSYLINVPKNMLQDSVIQAVLADTTHPLRQALAANTLMNWAPQTPVTLITCKGDRLVSYLNTINAHNNWTTLGAPNVDTIIYGNFDHSECIPFGLLAMFGQLDALKSFTMYTDVNDPLAIQDITIYPNPGKGIFKLDIPSGLLPADIIIQDVLGKEIYRKKLTSARDKVDISKEQPAVYFYHLVDEVGQLLKTGKLLVE